MPRQLLQNQLGSHGADGDDTPVPSPGQERLTVREAQIQTLTKNHSPVPTRIANTSTRTITGLTCREEAVITLLGHGKTSKEIAIILRLAPGTVASHRRSLCRKLNLHSTAELIRRAVLLTQTMLTNGAAALPEQL